MKVTGYQLMDRIEVLREQAQTINGQFTGSLFRFAEATEEKPDPRDLMKDYAGCERKVALLQAAQAAYNVRVTIDVLGEQMLLQQAIKLIGSINRVKNNWLAAMKTSQDKNSYSSYYELVRDKTNEYAQRVVSIEECLRLSKEASDLTTALKQAIRTGNAAEIEIDLDPSIFR
jgi:prophage DNA circulation protein